MIRRVVVTLALLACDRHHTVKIIVPAGHVGWFEVVELPGVCPPAGINGPSAVIVVEPNHLGCIGEHWTPRGFTHFVYVDSEGRKLAADQVHGQTGPSHAQTGAAEKRSFYFCVGAASECGSAPPYEPPGGYGWKPRTTDGPALQ